MKRPVEQHVTAHGGKERISSTMVDNLFPSLIVWWKTSLVKAELRVVKDWSVVDKCLNVLIFMRFIIYLACILFKSMPVLCLIYCILSYWAWIDVLKLKSTIVGIYKWEMMRLSKMDPYASKKGFWAALVPKEGHTGSLLPARWPHDLSKRPCEQCTYHIRIFMQALCGRMERQKAL